MGMIKFHKTLAVPGTWDTDSLYFVKNGSYAEMYITDASGTPRSLGNSTMITNIANDAITQALATTNLIEIVPNIAARDALASVNRNQLVLVTDATGDASVTAGAALYAFRNSDDTWHKVSEYESMDVVMDWANIANKPTSSVAAIDAAVTNAHTHSNSAVLNATTAAFTTALKTSYDQAVVDMHVHANDAVLSQLTDASGNLQYKGASIGTVWTTANW